MKYDSRVVERGKAYYRNNLVKYCIKFGDHLFGEVFGSELYRVKVDLKDHSSICSCPYRFNCKHGYALIEAYKNNNYIDGDEIFNNLKNKSKEELLDILKELVVKNYLWDYFVDVDSLIYRAIGIIKLIPIEKKHIFTLISFLRNCFVKNAKDEELLRVIVEMLKMDLDFNDSNIIEALTLILDEIFERKNKETIKKLVDLYKKNRKELWLVQDYLIENWDYLDEFK
ncbi:MAG: SWIM zinc finger family protein [Methanococci archaeon]|nr:SWIM zinc finger family protein [Methanococci archaeon]